MKTTNRWYHSEHAGFLSKARTTEAVAEMLIALTEMERDFSPADVRDELERIAKRHARPRLFDEIVAMTEKLQ